MEREYINNLMKQFLNTQQIKDIKINSVNFKQEFAIWLNEMQKISKGYVELLEDLKVPYDKREVSEIGKGKYDSIVIDNKSTIMITPYITEKVQNPVVIGQFTVNDSKPAVIQNGNIINVSIDNIMTHNPYSETDIYNWHELYNINECNITVGIYGKITDRNRREKMKLLEKLKRELYFNGTMDGYEERDNYYYAITTCGKVKVKTKYYGFM